MTVSTIASVAANITRTTGDQSARAVSTLRDLVAAAPSTTTNNATDTASFPTAAVLQNQVASLRAATQSIASAGSLLEVAQGGTSAIAGVLGQLQDLAARASDPSLSLSERTQLNSQASAIRAQINQINATTSFNGEALLDGKSAQLQIDTGNGQASAIGGLTENDLFGGNQINLLTADGAQKAAEVITKAQNYVATQSSQISALQSGVSEAAATVESALQNNAAANSTLSEADFVDVGSATGESPQARLLSQTAAAQSVQAGRLPGNILALLAE